MTNVRFYQGLREIGGTFAAVEANEAVCMFDFGMAQASLLDDKIRLNEEDAAENLVRLGFLAAADGIYNAKTAHALGLAAYGETKKQPFFIISHMHIDHMGGLGLLDPGVPVYMTEESLKLYRALAKTSQLQIGGEHENCIGVSENEPFTIGDITVTLIPIDHDVNGACGALIETPQGTVAYTGDYRFHGFHPDKTRDFARRIKAADVLITEGVSLSFDDVDILSLTVPEEKRTEETLLAEMDELMEAERGLILINPYIRNAERLHLLQQRAEAKGRTLVTDGETAAILQALYPQDRRVVLSETDRFETRAEHVTLQDLLNNPSDYLLQLDYGDLMLLQRLKPVVSRFIHMDGTPLGDYDPSYNRLMRLLDKLGIEFDRRSIGGHADPWHIRYMIDTVEPKTLVPLHSFRPEQVNSRKCGRRVLPDPEKTYRLGVDL